MQNFKKMVLGSAYLLALGFHSVSIAEEAFETMLKRMPSSANSVLAIDADALRNSQMGKAQNWASRNEAAFTNSAFYLPPEASKLLVSAQMNPNRQFSVAWQAALMALAEPMSARGIARAEGGVIDEIAETPSVKSPNDAYFLLFADRELGVMSPANRQIASSWIKANGMSGNVSPYLANAIQSKPATAQILFAMDLQDAVEPGQVSASLAEVDELKNDVAKQNAWQALIVSLKGVRFSVQVDTEIEGTLEVDFGNDPAVLGKQAKDAVVSAFQRFGIGFDSVEKWHISQSQNSLILNGPMELQDLRRVMSLLELPSSNFSKLASVEPAKENETDKVVAASKEYFTSVSTLLDDLEREFKNNRDARRNFAATYMQRYAKRIDQLPILNVDKDLVDYAMSVSETLRSTSVTQGEANIEAGIRKSSVYQSNNYGYYNDYRSTSSIKSQIAREEQGTASKERFNNWKEVQDATASIRVAMTQKYNTEF